MQIKWHRLARQDLHSLRAYIAEDSPQAASDTALRILRSIESLMDNPAPGRPGRVLDTRELIVANTSYLVPYKVMGAVIVILRVLHGARQWPDVLG